MHVETAMHKGARFVAPDTPVKAIAALMKKEDIGVVPVTKDQRVIGIVTDRDLAIRSLSDSLDPATLTAADVMSKNITFCRSGQTVEDAIRLMQHNKIRRLPVIDDQEHLIGMLSLGDLSHHVSREICGSLVRAVAAPH